MENNMIPGKGICNICGSTIVFASGVDQVICPGCDTEVFRYEIEEEETFSGDAPAAAESSFLTVTRCHIRRIPSSSPREYYEMLGKLGYMGQDRGRKAISLMAYRHIRRIKKIYLEETPREKLHPKFNYLMIGPTGCGKTFLVELLFKKILKIPTVIVDITNYSETGYVGDDAKTILTRLVYAAKGNPLWASCGVICLDEFDKLSSGQSNVRFEGQGTTKDVTGFGVQKELLRMLEGGEIIVPLDFGFSHYGSRLKMSTDDISFLACGAFSGYKSVAEKHKHGEKLGFRWKPKAKFHEKISVLYDEEELDDIESFHIYGFLPELIGRFTRIVPFDPLDEATLKDILKSNVIASFLKEFEDEGLELSISEDVLNYIVKESVKRQTGARGLNSLLTRHLEGAAYQSFHTKNGGRITLEVENGEIRVEARVAGG